MCIFNLPVKEVNGTRIFVGPTADGRQLTCYQNYVKFQNKWHGWEQADVLVTPQQYTHAMILPFPLAATSPGSKKPLELVDLSACPKLVEELEDAFPKLQFSSNTDILSYSSRGSWGKPESEYLAVEKCGSYSCSVALGLADLRRIDPRVFKVSPLVDKVLGKHYPQGFGFLVCKLNKEGKQHPIAYVHDMAPDGQLFVPCRHEHGERWGLSESFGAGSGQQEEEEEEEEGAFWDHYIYSSNTSEAKQAGNTAEEESKRLVAKATEKNRADSTLGSWTVSAPQRVATSVLHDLPVRIAKVTHVRRLRVEGHAPNRDLRFSIHSSAKPTTAAATKPVVLDKPPAAPGGPAPAPDLLSEFPDFFTGDNKAAQQPQQQQQQQTAGPSDATKAILALFDQPKSSTAAQVPGAPLPVWPSQQQAPPPSTTAATQPKRQLSDIESMYGPVHQQPLPPLHQPYTRPAPVAVPSLVDPYPFMPYIPQSELRGGQPAVPATGTGQAAQQQQAKPDSAFAFL